MTPEKFKLISELIKLDITNSRDNVLGSISDRQVKFFWNLYTRFNYKAMPADMTDNEIKESLMLREYRGIPVPNYIIDIDSLFSVGFLDVQHQISQFSDQPFEVFLADMIVYIKNKLFTSNDFPVEVLEWLKSFDVQINTSKVQFDDECMVVVNEEKNYATQGVNLVGWPNTEIGIGEDVRVAAMSFEKNLVPFSILDAAKRIPPQPKQEKLGFDKYFSNNPIYDTDIIFLDAATQFRYHFYDLIHNKTSGRKLILVAPCELPIWPERLSFTLDYIDEFWAATTYIYNVFEPFFKNKSIKLAPPAVYLESDVLDDFDVCNVDDPFTFMTTFDGLSSIYRKNPFAVVRAFQLAFPKNKDVKLIIKTMNFEKLKSQFSSLQEMIRSDDRIEVINTILPKKELITLAKKSHCFVSLHRAEGFGRNIAEHMLLNRPVICSNFSGNLDFCFQDNSYLVDGKMVNVEQGQYSFSEGQQWFDPSIEDAAAQMKNVFYDRQTARDKALKAKSHMQSFHSIESCGARYTALLRGG